MGPTNLPYGMIVGISDDDYKADGNVCVTEIMFTKRCNE